MREKLEFPQQAGQEKQIEKNENVFREVRKTELEKIFEENLSEESRRQALLNQYAFVLESKAIKQILGEKKLQEIQEDLIKHCQIKDKKKFIETVIIELEPFLDLQKNNPQVYENFIREKGIKERGFIPVDEKHIFSYGVNDGILHFHLGSAKTIEPSVLLHSFKKALDKFAQIVAKDQSIKVIQGTSEIVFRFANILEKRYGFIIEGEIDEEIKEKYFPESKEKIYRASMTRENFLRRYLKAKTEY